MGLKKITEIDIASDLNENASFIAVQPELNDNDEDVDVVTRIPFLALINALVGASSFQTTSTNRTFAESNNIPYIDDAIENETIYRVVGSKIAHVEGTMIFCGNKNRTGSNASQIRFLRDNTNNNVGGIISYRVGQVQSGGTVNWSYDESDPDNPVQLWDTIYLSDIKHEAIDNKADLDDIPTKVSELINDSGYLAQHQDISGKANYKIAATDKTFADNNPEITYIDDATEYGVIYRVVSNSLAKDDGWLYPCGNKDRSSTYITQVRFSKTAVAPFDDAGNDKQTTESLMIRSGRKELNQQSEEVAHWKQWKTIYLDYIEQTNNKVKSISSSSPSDVKYPTEKAVSDYVSAQIGDIESLLAQI